MLQSKCLRKVNSILYYSKGVDMLCFTAFIFLINKLSKRNRFRIFYKVNCGSGYLLIEKVRLVPENHIGSSFKILLIEVE